MLGDTEKRQGYLYPDWDINMLASLPDAGHYSLGLGPTVASSQPHIVRSHSELLTRIAYLRQSNPNLELFFRGQRKDYQCLDLDFSDFRNPDETRQKSCLYPTLLREIVDFETGELRDGAQVNLDGPGHLPLDKFVKEIQQELCNRLPSVVSFDEGFSIWSQSDHVQSLAVLQHYEVIPTQVFDVTSDVVTALSFGYDQAKKSCFLYIFGVPYRGEPISIFSNENLIVIDLRKLLPPEALRPHIQNGFMLASHPAIYQGLEGLVYSFEKDHAFPLLREWDFSKFLLAKFEIAAEYWDSEFAPNLYPDKYYFPDQKDLMFAVANELRESVGLLQPSATQYLDN